MEPAAIRRRITARSLSIISTLTRYPLAPTPLLLPLVGGNPAVTYRHLRDLYDMRLVNRFVLPTVGAPGSFVYYLDNGQALDLLAARHGLAVAPGIRQSVWRNREKAYAELLDPLKAAARLGSLLYIEHELAIARLHFALEMACGKSKGQVRLKAWRQGAGLWESVEAPAAGPGAEKGQRERLPHRPDAFFTLEFPLKNEPQRLSHFFFEADRNTESVKTFRRKLRAYFAYVVRERRHRTSYGLARVRAVLVQTVSPARVRQLHEAARHPEVSGENPSPLFWFTLAALMTKTEPAGESGRLIPRYLARPETVFERLWLPADSDRELCSLLD